MRNFIEKGRDLLSVNQYYNSAELTEYEDFMNQTQGDVLTKFSQLNELNENLGKIVGESENSLSVSAQF